MGLVATMLVGVMQFLPLPVLRSDLPGWLSVSIVVVAIAFALLAIGLMFVRVRSDDARGGNFPTRYLDPVLVISAIVVILLALAAIR
jgi:amino acid transporter